MHIRRYPNCRNYLKLHPSGVLLSEFQGRQTSATRTRARKGYFHSTMLMQALRIGFLSERQKRARGGRGLADTGCLRGVVRRLAAALMVPATPAAASAVFQLVVAGLGGPPAPAADTDGRGDEDAPPPGGGSARNLPGGALSVEALEPRLF